MARQSFLGTLAKLALGALETATRRPRRGRDDGLRGPRPGSRGQSGGLGDARAEAAPSGIQTVELRPEDVPRLRLSYAPQHDGEADAGEVVWTWVPYAENDGRGKDRPVLLIARHGADRHYAVKLTSKSKDGDREFLPLGSGPWDPAGRESWVDLDQLYSVHADGMRREAAALDLDRFTRVAAALQRRYGWGAGS
ncbi:type II toxin-antitoxin system PemK/MazF family toxin [Microbacterium lacusdiani]